MRIVLDTNILVSAFISARDAPARVFDLWQDGTLEIVTSQDTLDELQRVLAYPRIRDRLQYSEEQIQRYLLLLRKYAIFLDDLPASQGVTADPDDDKFLVLAQVSSADYIVSGDDHLLSAGVYQGIEILTAPAFLDLFTSSP